MLAATPWYDDPFLTTVVGGVLTLAGGILTALWLRNRDANTAKSSLQKRLRAAAITIISELAGNKSRLDLAVQSRPSGRLTFSLEHYRSLQLLLAENAPLELLGELHIAYEPLLSEDLYKVDRTITGAGGIISERIELDVDAAKAQSVRIEHAAAAMRAYRDSLKAVGR